MKGNTKQRPNVSQSIKAHVIQITIDINSKMQFNKIKFQRMVFQHATYATK